MEKYWKVTAKCGHVGRDRYIAVDFAVRAENGKTAAAVARLFPRVKHNHPDAILDVCPINREEYLVLLEPNKSDPYLHCPNVQEQRRIEDLGDRMFTDTHGEPTYKKTKSMNRRMRRSEVDEYERRSEMERGRFDEWIA